MDDLKWVFDVLESDRKLGRLTTAEDLEPLTPSQRRRRKTRHTDPAIAAIYAQVPVLEDLLGITLHVDHIKPLAKGGQHTADNLQIVPADLNLRKNDKEGKYAEFAD